MKKIIRERVEPDNGCRGCFFEDTVDCRASIDCNIPFYSIFREVDDNITVGSSQFINDKEYNVESITETSEGVMVKLK